MNFLRLGSALFAFVWLTACSTEPTCDYSKAPYMAARSVPSLKVPEGMSQLDRTAALTVPDASTSAPPAPSGKGKCLDRPPSYFATSPTPSAPTPPEKK